MNIDTREGFKAYLDANRFYNIDGIIKPLTQIEAELHHSVTRVTILAWMAELAPAAHAALVAVTPEAELPVELTLAKVGS